MTTMGKRLDLFLAFHVRRGLDLEQQPLKELQKSQRGNIWLPLIHRTAMKIRIEAINFPSLQLEECNE